MAKAKRTVQLLLALAAIAAIAHGATTTHHLQFYMHDTITPTAGNPATSVLVVRGPTPAPGDPDNRLGDTYVIDDPLTEGPDLTSRTVGRAQGFYLIASQPTVDAVDLLLSANMMFTAGRHNGSSVTVLGRDAIFDEVREVPVMGGTGVFRGAAGYTQIRTSFINVTTKNAVLKVDMFISV